jgi:hypothetical protein
MLHPFYFFYDYPRAVFPYPAVPVYGSRYKIRAVFFAREQYARPMGRGDDWSEGCLIVTIHGTSWGHYSVSRILTVFGRVPGRLQDSGI